VQQAYDIFTRLITYYGVSELLHLISSCDFSLTRARMDITRQKLTRNEWLNVGGQLIPKEEITSLCVDIKENRIRSWNQVHDFYKHQGESYPLQRRRHAIASLLELEAIQGEKITPELLKNWMKLACDTRTWIMEAIIQSRKKDYTNPFRK